MDKIMLFPLSTILTETKLTLPFRGLVLTSLAVLSFSVSADALDNARNIEAQTNKDAVAAQNKINVNSDQSFQLQAEVERLQAEVDNLSVYQNHLKKLVASQEAEKVSIDNQLIEISETRQGVVPLMYHMIDGLQALIEQGVPVRFESRTKRLDSLKTLMGRADISDAEKYRRILEAYQIEMDYGSKLGVYEGAIQVSEQDSRQVDILYVGRISLIARSKDAQSAWLWSQADQQWQAIDAKQQVEINKAFAMATKQQAPSLLTLPLSLTDVSTQEAK